MNANIQEITEAKQAMLYGTLWCVGGIIATAATDGNVLFWGAILIGGIQLISGVFKFLTNGGLSQSNSNSSSNNSYSTIHTCHNCHKENEKDAKYCIYCGATLTHDTPINPLENTLFGYAVSLIAYVAKADGVISKNEATFISELLTHISDGNVDVRNALKEIYQKAKDSKIHQYRLIAEKMHRTAQKEFNDIDREGFYQFFIRWLMLLVYADGPKNVAQNTLAENIALILGVNHTYVEQLHKEFAPSGQQQEKPFEPRSSNLDDSYKVLKCNPSDSDEHIKKAYRELAKQYHPDVINSKGLAEDFILFANQKLKEINSAYDTIKKSRGMK